MDKSAPWTVLQGTLAISALSAAATGILSISTGLEQYGLLAGVAAFNSGITAATFFGLREFVVGPVLVHTLPTEQYERRRRELGIGKHTAEAESTTTGATSPSFSDMRSHKVLDSTLSGAATGGILRGWRTGPRAALPGAITVGAVCALLQLGYNEIGVQRLKYITRRRAQGFDASPPTSQQLDTVAASPDSLKMTSVEQPTTWKAQILSLMGIRKMSEEEYLERLRLQRNHHLLRIKELERKLEEEKKAKERE